MTSRLVDAGGDFLVDAFGDYLVWEVEFATGRMSLVASAPSMVLYAEGALGDVLTFTITDENGDAITDEAGNALRVVPLLAAPTITLTTSED